MAITVAGKKAGKIWLEGKKVGKIWCEGRKIYDSRSHALPDDSGEMVLVVNIPSNNYALDLSPWLSAAPGDGTTDISVDWGDVAVASVNRARSVANNCEVYTVEEREDESVSEEDWKLIEEENQIAALADDYYPVEETQPGTGTIIHTYTVAGEYRITLKGEFQWGLGKSTISNLALQQTLTRIELPTGKSPIKYVTVWTFYACTKLESIPVGLFDKCTAVVSFMGCFYDCAALTSIPDALFDKCTAGDNFAGCFMNCRAITSALPKLWSSHHYAIHTNCFRNCTKATNYDAAYAAGWAS